MTLPVFRAAGSDVNVVSSGGASAVPVPTGTALGDLIFFLFAVGPATSPTVTGPSGFTLLDSVATTAFTTGLYLYYKVASGSEPASYNVSQTGGNVGRAKMWSYSGVNATPINVNSKSAQQNGVTTVSIQAATTTVSDCMMLSVAFEYNGRTPTITVGGTQTDRGGSTASGLVFKLGEEGITTAGAVSGRSDTSSISGDFYSFAVALAPAVGGDTTAPTLTSPTGAATGSTTATGGATTDEANGTIYTCWTTTATTPTAVQVEAGQNSAGAAAAAASSSTVSSTGAKTNSATGLTASTTYYAHTMHKDAAGNRSNVVTSASFTTSAGSSGSKGRYFYQFGSPQC